MPQFQLQENHKPWTTYSVHNIVNWFLLTVSNDTKEYHSLDDMEAKHHGPTFIVDTYVLPVHIHRLTTLLSSDGSRQ